MQIVNTTCSRDATRRDARERAGIINVIICPCFVFSAGLAGENTFRVSREEWCTRAHIIQSEWSRLRGLTTKNSADFLPIADRFAAIFTRVHVEFVLYRFSMLLPQAFHFAFLPSIAAIRWTPGKYGLCAGKFRESTISIPPWRSDYVGEQYKVQHIDVVRPCARVGWMHFATVLTSTLQAVAITAGRYLSLRCCRCSRDKDCHARTRVYASFECIILNYDKRSATNCCVERVNIQSESIAIAILNTFEGRHKGLIFRFSKLFYTQKILWWKLQQNFRNLGPLWQIMTEITIY